MSIKINKSPVANAYGARGERIIEFSTNDGRGGLISFQEDDDGQIVVELYRLEGVVVKSPSI